MLSNIPLACEFQTGVNYSAVSVACVAAVFFGERARSGERKKCEGEDGGEKRRENSLPGSIFFSP